MGNDLNILRKRPKNLLVELRLPLLFAGCKEIGMRSGVGGTLESASEMGGSGGGRGTGNGIVSAA